MLGDNSIKDSIESLTGSFLDDTTVTRRESFSILAAPFISNVMPFSSLAFFNNTEEADSSLLKIVKEEANFLEMRKDALKRYTNHIKLIEKRLINEARKTENQTGQLSFMYMSLKYMGFNISNKGTNSQFMILSGFNKKTFDCDQMAIILSTISKDYLDMKISPLLVLAPHAPMGHTLLEYTIDSKEHLFDPLSGKKTTKRTQSSNFGLSDNKLAYFKLDKEGPLALGYNGIGTYFFYIYQNTKNLNALYKAKKAFTRIIDLDNTKPLGFLQRASLYAIAGQYDKAIADNKEILKIIPNFPLIFASIGDSYSMSGRKEKSVKWYEKSLEICKQDPNTYNSLITRLQNMISSIAK